MAALSLALVGGIAYAKDCVQADFRVVINGEYEDIAYEKSQGKLYIPARQVFESLGAKVSWNESKVVLSHGDSSIYPEFYLKNGLSYVSASYVADTFGFSVLEYPEINVLNISSKTENNADSLLKELPDYDHYTYDDLNWLSRIIHAESDGEPYEAKIAVGNVILNRVASPMYPDTIKDVIFDKKGGVQFAPTIDGSIYNTPSSESFLAAYEVLEGKRNAEDALFFINPRYAKSSWVSLNRPYAFTLENHDFYY
ncbi:MAG: cell wall hydrolase [Clostridiales bacterium]|nr:cell wall hydrolase [Clostridiales bacterium]